MLSRAPRQAPLATHTPDNLGPGAYTPLNNTVSAQAARHKSSSLAPFGSNAPRLGLYDQRAAELPGPGQYAPSAARVRQPARRGAANAAFGSGTSRFGARRGGGGDGDDGPTSYLAHREWGAPDALARRHEQTQRLRRRIAGKGGVPARRASTKPKRGRRKKSKKKKKKKQARGARAQSAVGARRRLKWLQTPTIPSIPARSQSHGYEEDGRGRWVRQKPSEAGHSGLGADMPGPGEYALDRGVAARGGTSWARSKAKRTDLAKAVDTPGPGAYFPDRKRRTRRAPKRGPNVFVSSAPRWKQDAEQGPGPGAYTLPSSIRVARPSTSAPTTTISDLMSYLTGEEEQSGQRAFGSSAPRFAEPVRREAAPGPGAYGSNILTMGSRDAHPVKYNDAAPPSGLAALMMGGEFEDDEPPRAPFNSASARFAPARAADLPGPGAYNVPRDTAVPSRSDTQRNRLRQLRPRQPLGGSSQRFNTRDPNADNPGPGAFDPVPPPSRCETGSSAFRSSTQRFSANSKVSDEPGPGDYAVEMPWKKKSGFVPDAGFSLARRFVTHKASDAPGPGAYAPEPVSKKPLSDSASGGPGASAAFRSTAPRIIDQSARADAPGPGAYANIQSTFGAQKSFNITLGNNAFEG